jgi:hypothetical protein
MYLPHGQASNDLRCYIWLQRVGVDGIPPYLEQQPPVIPNSLS